MNIFQRACIAVLNACNALTTTLLDLGRRRKRAGAKPQRLMICALLGATSMACGSVTETAQQGDGEGSGVVRGDSENFSSSSLAEEGNVEIVATGFTQGSPDSIGNSYLTYAAVIKNTGPTVAEYVTVNLTFKDSEGTVVKAANENISVMLPGQTNAVGDSTSAEGATQIEVQALVSRWLEPETEFGSFAISGITTRSDEYGMETNASVASTFDKDLRDTKATAVYYDEAGSVIGGAYTFVDFVPAGGNIGIEIRAQESLKNVATTDIFLEITSLTLME